MSVRIEAGSQCRTASAGGCTGITLCMCQARTGEGWWAGVLRSEEHPPPESILRAPTAHRDAAQADEARCQEGE